MINKTAIFFIIGAMAAAVGIFLVLGEPRDEIDSNRPSHKTTAASTKDASFGIEGQSSERLLWDGLNFQSKFSEIKSSAERGDPRAQRELSFIYGQCFQYNLDPKKYFLTPLERIEEEHPEYSLRLRKIRNQYSIICSSVDNGEPIPSDAIDLWLEQSAKGGDLVAELMMVSRSTELLDRKKLDDFMRKIERSKDPAALFMAGDLAGAAASFSDDPEISRLFSGPYASYAWQVAACRTGYDCSENSALMTNLCIRSALCEYSNYEAVVLGKVVPFDERRKFEENVIYIMSHFRGK